MLHRRHNDIMNITYVPFHLLFSLFYDRSEVRKENLDTDMIKYNQIMFQ